ncbi:hypothetical protein EJ065_6552 [Corallococcus coralloides]|uniref:Uncharacterized protein n=2 Tax=Corallococcus coralloides TaxID=184914 RepID=A0A410S1Q5_CORCK|nr:hypothetical protein EJ065_6552 [Corallococcus coralloides]
MGVVYLLSYIFGGVAVTLGLYRLLGDLRDGSPLGGTLLIVAFGAGLVSLGGLLHVLVERRRNPGGAPRELPRMGRRMFALVGAMWALPIVAAWIQFELFIEPTYMAPDVTVLGGIGLTFGVCSRVMAKWPMRWATATMAVALIGLPLGLLGVALPIRHFTHHLTDVAMVLHDDNSPETRTVTFNGDAPSAPAVPVGVGDEMTELLSAYANAREIDVAAEIAAGRMRQLEDGRYVTVNPDGTEAPIGTAAQLEQAFDDALAADDRKAAEEQAARRAEWEQEMRERKRGGRLFSRGE